MESAALIGRGWQPWRGAWGSSRCLVGTDAGWRAEIDGRGAGAVGEFARVVARLWEERAVRDAFPG